MVLGKLNVHWEDLALMQLGRACTYISRDSLKNAQKVRREIFSATRSLATQPSKYPPDKYKYNNDGAYRAFEIYHFRITYKITASEVRILMVRHTSMEPLEY